MPKLPQRTEQNQRLWERAFEACGKKEALRGCRVSFLQSVLMIENQFRPRYFRVGEYGALLATGLLGAVFGRPVHSWTIGPCQLGLPTILEYYRTGQDKLRSGDLKPGELCFPEDTAVFHQPSVRLKSLGELWQLFSVIRLSRSMDILAWRLSAAAEKAEQDYPGRLNLQLRALGTEFGGRFSYGLMAERVWKEFETPIIT
jgi:hypothetical protein